MTLLILLVWGLGSALMVSAIETDPNTGKSVSLRQTISDIWNDKVSLAQPDFAQQGNQPRTPGQYGQPYVAPAITPPAGNPGGVVWVNSAGTVVGRAEGPDQFDAYRAAVVRAYIQSRR